MQTMDLLPSFLANYLRTHYAEQLDTLSQLNLANAGGIYLYGMSFIMLFVPLAMICFESWSRSWQEKMEVKPPLPPATVISELRVYPIKSCRGIVLNKAKLLKTGLDLDRKWMWVDAETKKFLTIREISEMTLIDVEISRNDELVVTAPKLLPGKEIRVAAHPSEKWLKQNLEHDTVTIWSKQTDAWLYPTELTAPFTKIFGKEVRLALKGPEPRILAGNGHSKFLGRVEKINFPDMQPVLVASEASLAELNSRLNKKGEQALTIERFRPNVIVKGTEPWEEDVWKTLSLGKDVVFDVTSRCARCQVPNVEPNTAEKHAKEPWTTLMSYRRIDEGMKYKPCFGMMCATRHEGELEVGMDLIPTDTTGLHKYLVAF